MVEYAESAPGGEDRTAAIIALEKHALELWNDGNPDGFIALSSDDVVYMDPALEHKLVGREALKAYYDPIRGKVKIPEYRMIDPVVQSVPDAAVHGEAALLTHIHAAATAVGRTRGVVGDGAAVHGETRRCDIGVRRADKEHTAAGGAACFIIGNRTTIHGKGRASLNVIM